MGSHLQQPSMLARAGSTEPPAMLQRLHVRNVNRCHKSIRAYCPCMYTVPHTINMTIIHRYHHNILWLKLTKNWRILGHFRSICYATFKSTRGWFNRIIPFNLMNWPLFWFLVSANGCEKTDLISFYRFFYEHIFYIWMLKKIAAKITPKRQS